MLLRDPRSVPRLALLVLGAVLLWPLVTVTEFFPGTVFAPRSLEATGRFLATFLPPATAPDFLVLVLRETWRTIAIATCGTVLALALAIPLALGATAVLSISGIGRPMARSSLLLRQALRVLMVALRTVPELVWALIFVRVVGLGPTAGVLAIALTYGGMLGKVYAEILESTDPFAARALLMNGSGRLQAFVLGLLPEARAELASYTIYRWECAIRSSVVLGFVGAGGLGQLMDGSLKMFAGSEVTTMLLVFVALVAAADLLSAWVRRELQ
jgi:phosphonate transport system permease protein